MDTVLLVVIGVIVVVLLAAVIWVLVARAGVVRADQRADAAWGALVDALRQRAAGIPELVEVLEPAGVHVGLRQRADAVAGELRDATEPRTAAQAEEHAGAVIRDLLASEAAAGLLSDEAFTVRQRALVTSGDAVQASRRNYNAAVRALRGSAKPFPGSLFASFVETDRAFFELDASEAVAEAPRVEF